MYIEKLNEYRKIRNFDTEKYIEAKTILINDYMKLIDHNCIIISISGGVDSATVLGLVIKAYILKDSPIKKIVAITIPEFVNGTTGQYESFYKSYILVKKLEEKYNIKIDFNCLDLSNIHNIIKNNIGFNIDSWAEGQIVSYSI